MLPPDNDPAAIRWRFWAFIGVVATGVNAAIFAVLILGFGTIGLLFAPHPGILVMLGFFFIAGPAPFIAAIALFHYRMFGWSLAVSLVKIGALLALFVLSGIVRAQTGHGLGAGKGTMIVLFL